MIVADPALHGWTVKFTFVVRKTKMLCQMVFAVESALLSRLFHAELIIVGFQVLSVRLQLTAECTGSTSILDWSVWSASATTSVGTMLVSVCKECKTYCQLSRLRWRDFS